MLNLILLIIFLIQFLVVLGALIFVIFLARPEVPFTGNGPHDKPSPDDRDHQNDRPDTFYRSLLSPGAQVLVPLHVCRGSADGHNIGMAIAVNVGDDHARSRHLRIQRLTLPF